MNIKNANSTINAVKSKVFDWFIGYIVPGLVMLIFFSSIEMVRWRVGVDNDLEDLIGLEGLVTETEFANLSQALEELKEGTALAKSGPLEISADSPGLVGGYPSGALQIRNIYADANANAVISGHNSNNINKQLWYIGSYSSRNDDIIYINRQNAALSFGTSNSIRLTIGADGSVGIGTVVPIPSSLLDLSTTTKGFLLPRMTTVQRNNITGSVAGLMIYNTTTGVLNFHNGISWGAI